MNAIEYLRSEHGLTVIQACQLVGLNHETYYVWRREGITDPEVIIRIPTKPNWSLPESVREYVKSKLRSPEYAGYSVTQAFFKLWFNEGMPCSLSTFHRIARELYEEQRTKRKSPNRASTKKPKGFVAKRPLEVLVWDITYLKKCGGGDCYLYTVMDYYSRYIVHAEVFAEQTAEHTVEIFRYTFDKYGLKGRNVVVHADNGSPMKAHCVKELFAEYGVIESHSRPHVSNDNSVMERFYSTIKYQYGLFGHKFMSIDEANAVLALALDKYHKAHHTSLNLATPEARFNGKDQEMIDQFNAHRAAYEEQYPERFANHRKREDKLKVAPPQFLNVPAERRQALLDQGIALTQQVSCPIA